MLCYCKMQCILSRERKGATKMLRYLTAPFIERYLEKSLNTLIDIAKLDRSKKFKQLFICARGCLSGFKLHLKLSH